MRIPNSLVTGGQVSRVNPESTGLNPAWRRSVALALLHTAWQDGANSSEIAAAREPLIHDMKLLEDLAPESGAYLNEVKHPHGPLHWNNPNSNLLILSGIEIRIQLEEILLWHAL